MGGVLLVEVAMVPGAEVKGEIWSDNNSNLQQLEGFPLVPESHGQISVKQYPLLNEITQGLYRIWGNVSNRWKH